MFFWFLCSQKVCKIFCIWLFSVHIFQNHIHFSWWWFYPFFMPETTHYVWPKFDKRLTKASKSTSLFFGLSPPLLASRKPSILSLSACFAHFSLQVESYVHSTTKSVLRLPEAFLFLLDLYYNLYYISVIICNIIVLYFYYIMFSFCNTKIMYFNISDFPCWARTRINFFVNSYYICVIFVLYYMLRKVHSRLQLYL